MVRTPARRRIGPRGAFALAASRAAGRDGRAEAGWHRSSRSEDSGLAGRRRRRLPASHPRRRAISSGSASTRRGRRLERLTGIGDRSAAGLLEPSAGTSSRFVVSSMVVSSASGCG